MKNNLDDAPAFARATRWIPNCAGLSLGVLGLALLTPFCVAADKAPTAAELANATYIGIEEHPIALLDGRWEGEPHVEGGASRPAAGLAEDFILSGDISGDGSSESAVVIWRTSGGSGTFSYLAVMGHDYCEVNNLGTAEVGDRVKIRKGRIDGQKIVLDVLQQGENDAACCPTQLATRNWSMKGGRLIEGEMEITGTLSVQTLVGTEWVLTRLDKDEVLVEETHVTLAFMDGQVSGKSACNRYSAGFEQGEAPSELNIGPSMGTRMACPDAVMELEHRYLEALAHVTDFSFLAGKLLLSGEKDENRYTMLFTPLNGK